METQHVSLLLFNWHLLLLSGSAVVHELKPSETRRFVWDDPAGVRTLSWKCREHSGEVGLSKVFHLVVYDSIATRWRRK